MHSDNEAGQPKHGFLQPLLAFLERRDVVSRTERAALEALTWRVRAFSPDAEIIPFGSRPEESCFITSGFAARSVDLSNGTRQLTSIHVPGDFVDLHGLLLKEMDHSIVALTDCTLAFARHSDLRQLSETFPHLWRLLSLTTAIDGAIQRSWIASLGRRGSVERLAHLICELYCRLDTVGEVAEGRFAFPLNQIRLADLLGLSVVQTNRALQTLRRTGVMAWSERTISVLDWAGLVAVARFDGTYLNLIHEPR